MSLAKIATVIRLHGETIERYCAQITFLTQLLEATLQRGASDPKAAQAACIEALNIIRSAAGGNSTVIPSQAGYERPLPDRVSQS